MRSSLYFYGIKHTSFILIVNIFLRSDTCFFLNIIYQQPNKNKNDNGSKTNNNNWCFFNTEHDIYAYVTA